MGVFDTREDTHTRIENVNCHICSANESIMDECNICKKAFLGAEAIVTLWKKGCEGIARASLSRGDDIHTEPDTFNHRRPKEGHKLVRVQTDQFHSEITTLCDEREDVWSHAVRGRLNNINDPFSADVVYHQVFSVNFRTNKRIPQQFRQVNYPPPTKRGRPQNVTQMEAFLNVATYLQENDDEQTTIHDLIDKMQEFLVDSSCMPYNFTYMKDQLTQHFSDSIVVAEINGETNVVTLRNNASKILQDFYCQSKGNNTETDKLRIIQTVAKLIKTDIQSVSLATDDYPSCKSCRQLKRGIAYLPEYCACCWMSCFHPKEDNSNTLSKFGFCSSYSEVAKFGRNAAITDGTDIPNLTAGHFVQYVADNVDHNVRTIDGMGTFHGMGMIAAITPEIKRNQHIPRACSTVWRDTHHNIRPTIVVEGLASDQEPTSKQSAALHCFEIRRLSYRDTTSRLFGLGKGLALKHIRTDVCFRAQAKVFLDGRSTLEDTAKAGESALVSLYKGSAGDTLDKLSLERFQQKVATSASCVRPENLPPTSSAAKFHSLRVYHQVQV
ncbi:hypothetical protein BSL78_16578 [Apostichopus japonicus]|uniref:Uncharacterized protein n=1 Tax=Stichopus japonicus TaxID=307972 RepID=A0A2G8KF34_STIJA|nr:hypothetical protein BSL78_16578 [Apostichopus japonicus]